MKELSRSSLLLDLGGGGEFQNPQVARLKHTLEGRYFCLDISAAKKPTVVGDVQRLPFRDDCCDGAICWAVLEHVPRPWEAVEEIHRVLSKSAFLLVYAPFLYPYHAHREGSDFWRFTEDSLRYLFRRFERVSIEPCSDFFGTAARFCLGFAPLPAVVKTAERILRLGAYFGAPLLLAVLRKDFTALEGLRRSTDGYFLLARK